MLRNTDTAKWDDSWWVGLSPYAKLVIDYIQDNCDEAGIWEANLPLAEYRIGFTKKIRVQCDQCLGTGFILNKTAHCPKCGAMQFLHVQLHLDWNEIFEECNTPPSNVDQKKWVRPLMRIGDGSKWWLTKFILFHYTTSNGETTLYDSAWGHEGKRHRPIFRTLRKHGLLDSFKEMFPNVKIVSSDENEFIVPTVEVVIAHAKKTYPNVPEDNIRLFFDTNSGRNWKLKGGGKPNTDWRGLLTTWVMNYELHFKPRTRSGPKMTINEIEKAIAGLKEQIETLKLQTEQDESGLLRIKPQAKTKISELRKQVEALESQRTKVISENTRNN